MSTPTRFPQLKGFSLAAAALTAVVHSDAAAAFGPSQPVFSLAPLSSCGAEAVCYEGAEPSLALVARFGSKDKSFCKNSLLRAGGCALYAFPERAGFAPLLPQVKTFKESAGPHLWFRTKGGSRCGEVDAAPRMPAAIFDPSNTAALSLYTKVTIAGFSPKLEVGRCADSNRTTEYNGVAPGAKWAPDSVMVNICNLNCDCRYDRGECKDEPDNPAIGRWCSLCGPKYNGPINITLYKAPDAPKPTPPQPTPTPPTNECNPTKGCNVCDDCCESYIPFGKSCDLCVEQKCAAGNGKTIVDLAVATPDLATLVTAVKAGDLVETLSGPGPFTVFAPTNEAFDALPTGTLATLLKPENKAQLVDVLTYHVVAGSVHAKDLHDRQMIKTVEGKELIVRISGNSVFINSAKVSTADVGASNGVVHIIDGVLLPKSDVDVKEVAALGAALLALDPDSSSASPPSALADAPGSGHLWFRWVNKLSLADPNCTRFGLCRCGEVDAGAVMPFPSGAAMSRVPAALFEPTNAKTLKAYADLTIQLYKFSSGLGPTNSSSMELGRCSEVGFDTKQSVIFATWAPTNLMSGICKTQCGCNYPACPDAPDQPLQGKWCSLCGPKYNSEFYVQLYNGIPTH